MTIKVGKTYLINGRKKTINSLKADGSFTTTDDTWYNAGFDIVEAL